MKKINHTIAFVFFSVLSFSVSAQEKNKLLLNLTYHNVNNYMQYLQAQARSKVDGRLTLVPGIEIKFYINSDSASGLLGKAVTDDMGNASVQIPASAKAEWDKSQKPGFIAEADESKNYTAGSSSFDLTKARLKIDTAADRKVIVSLVEMKDSIWVPAKGVDLKIGVKRQASNLNIGETDTYTTDSLGMVSADFTRKDLPGDDKGNLTLVARIEDNDSYGSISAEKPVPWGVATVYQSNYDKRTLFARKGRAPIWLDFISFSIMIGVWGVLLYLLFQVRRLKKLGTVKA